MEILVVVGRAPVSSMEIQLDRKSGRIDLDDIVYTTSRHDWRAVELALQMKKAAGTGTVTLITIGNSQLIATLRAYLSLGADDAILVKLENATDYGPYGLASAISGVIRKMEYDIILCGGESIDGEGCSYFPGPYIAEMLGLAHVSGVTEVELNNVAAELRVQKKLERGDRQIVKCYFPCLLSIEPSADEPVYPTFPDSLAALTKEIKVIGLSEGVPGQLVKFTGFSNPVRRVKKGLVVDTKLSAAERLKMVMSGGQSTKNNSQQSLTGEPEKLAGDLTKILVQQGILRKITDK